MARKKILCFGELLFRISPSTFAEAAGKHPMQLFVGGAEVNVATALAGWNVPVKYCTLLPDNFMSRHVINYLEYKGIYTSSIHFGGNRIGVYYLERGADLKGNMVYDREGSSFAAIRRGVIEWDRVLQDVEWFNFSAISPALNASVADVCMEALEACVARGIKVSVDLNYRERLWQYGEKPVAVMTGLVKHCDVVMGNLWSANSLLGVKLYEQLLSRRSKEAYLEHGKQTSEAIMEKFPRCKTVANTFRFDAPGEDLSYYTSLYHNGEYIASKEYSATRVVDRSGSGDCFMAGLIYGLYHQHPNGQLLNYATAAAFGKLQEMGDATMQDVFMVNTQLPPV